MQNSLNVPIPSFDLDVFSSIELDMESLVFFNMNKLPYLPEKRPDLDEIKNQMITYFEKLYNKFKNEKDKNNEPYKLNRTYLDYFDNKNKNKVLDECMGNIVDMYVNSTCLAKLLHIYYFLFNYHKKLLDKRFKLGFNLFKSIFFFLKGINQKELLNALKEICCDRKMYNFYIDLHVMITEELDDILIRRLSE